MPKTLFHYCSTTTAFSILEGRTIRLSALSAANDSLEGRVLGRVFTNLIRRSELPQGVADVASIIVEGYAGATEGFAFCLSEDGDLLSQWRAYAQDGNGVAIGFNSEWLSRDFGNVNFGSRYYTLEKVSYGETELHVRLEHLVSSLSRDFSQLGEFVRLKSGLERTEILSLLSDREANVEGLFVAVGQDSTKMAEALMKRVGELHFGIYSTKPSGFNEECEWRLLRYRHRSAFPEIKFAADQSRIKPFIQCLIADKAKLAIERVVLGPKNQSNINWVRAFLQQVGLSHVTVTRSNVDSYR